MRRNQRSAHRRQLRPPRHDRNGPYHGKLPPCTLPTPRDSTFVPWSSIQQTPCGVRDSTVAPPYSVSTCRSTASRVACNAAPAGAIQPPAYWFGNKCQNRSVSSPAPVTTTSPSGRIATNKTRAVCPLSVAACGAQETRLLRSATTPARITHFCQAKRHSGKLSRRACMQRRTALQQIRHSLISESRPPLRSPLSRGHQPGRRAPRYLGSTACRGRVPREVPQIDIVKRESMRCQQLRRVDRPQGVTHLLSARSSDGTRHTAPARPSVAGLSPPAWLPESTQPTTWH